MLIWVFLDLMVAVSGGKDKVSSSNDDTETIATLIIMTAAKQVECTRLSSETGDSNAEEKHAVATNNIPDIIKAPEESINDQIATVNIQYNANSTLAKASQGKPGRLVCCVLCLLRFVCAEAIFTHCLRLRSLFRLILTKQELQTAWAKAESNYPVYRTDYLYSQFSYLR